MTSSSTQSLLRLNGNTNKREARVPLSSSGNSVAAQSGSLWVASEKARTVTRIDLDTRTVTKTISLTGGRPVVVAADRDTGIWVGVRVKKENRERQVPSVVQIDPQTNTTKPVVLRHTVQHLGAGLGAAWVIYRNWPFITRIDAAGNVEHMKIPSRDPQRVAVGSKYVWVTNGTDGTVIRIRWRGRLKRKLRLAGSAPGGIAVGAGSVWVADRRRPRLIGINPANMQAAEPPIDIGGAGDPIAVAAHGRHVWVTTEGGFVVRVDRDRDSD
jgi:streptogramin lyase